ncbi:hypothetical protein [Breoghania sp.]|uniref:hypothetical protein n=1 Tax=Breoghania sp. TaxID=2065378 RepID=UPI00262CD2C1|nr:hypothetical protein [Breoghania sp.]MDJ0929613.1 hypothetical protein [Breoghania sp.]
MGQHGWRERAAFVVVGLSLADCAGQAANSASSWYAQHDSVAPRGDKVVICHDFGCASRTPVRFSAKDLSRLKFILSEGAELPQAERKAVARAVQWQERRVVPTVGSANGKGGMTFDSGVRGQIDCIDEATNTTNLLLVAQRHGLLKYHEVRSPVARGFFLDGCYPHAIGGSGGKEQRKDLWGGFVDP